MFAWLPPINLYNYNLLFHYDKQANRNNEVSNSRQFLGTSQKTTYADRVREIERRTLLYKIDSLLQNR